MIKNSTFQALTSINWHFKNIIDGALHMIGTMADILLKKKIYKEKMEQFLAAIVFPEFNSPHGHLRARACWMLHYFADVKYKNPDILDQSFKLTIARLLKQDEEVPVKVEAAIALQMMLTSQVNMNLSLKFVVNIPDKLNLYNILL